MVGHSDGGKVGLLLARRHPELVRRLVISGANIRGYRALPRGQLCILPASGHATMQERVDEFNQASRAFLEEAAPR